MVKISGVNMERLLVPKAAQAQQQQPRLVATPRADVLIVVSHVPGLGDTVATVSRR